MRVQYLTDNINCWPSGLITLQSWPREKKTEKEIWTTQLYFLGHRIIEIECPFTKMSIFAIDFSWKKLQKTDVKKTKILTTFLCHILK